jgi:hypothetical protein
MKSSIIKHSIVIAGRKTSVSLERTFWDSLREIAKERNEAFAVVMWKAKWRITFPFPGAPPPERRSGFQPSGKLE